MFSFQDECQYQVSGTNELTQNNNSNLIKKDVDTYFSLINSDQEISIIFNKFKKYSDRIGKYTSMLNNIDKSDTKKIETYNTILIRAGNKYSINKEIFDNIMLKKIPYLCNNYNIIYDKLCTEGNSFDLKIFKDVLNEYSEYKNKNKTKKKCEKDAYDRLIKKI